MANEKRTSINFSVVASGLTNQLTASYQSDLAGTNYLSIVQSIPTSWTAINVTGLASVDLLCVKNKDATNFIQLALANDGTKIFSKLTAGRAAYIPAQSGETYYAKADTATCDLQVVVVEP